MQFQWYPGHMTKAKRAMQEDIKLIDVIIELVDSRVPYSSKNPDIDQLANGKSRILLINMIWQIRCGQTSGCSIMSKRVIL